MHGSGPPLVCPAWWVSHLESDWEAAGFREFFDGLAEHRTVVRYDRPGTGLSDRQREVVELEDEVRTLAALVDHLELQRFDIFALSCAGPPSIAYAAAHSERVARLVLFGSFVRGADVGPSSVKEAIQALVRSHWGIGSRVLTDLFAPGLPADAVSQMSRHQRNSASAEMAARLLTLTFDVDVDSVATSLQTPTLVVHRSGDRAIRHEAGRELAAALPNASFVTLDGNAHVPWLGDRQRALQTVLQFLGVMSPPAERAISDPAVNRFERSGDVWTVQYAGRAVHMKHARGLADLAVLMTNADQEVHVAELYSGGESATTVGGGADPVLDFQALRAYRKRLREIDEAALVAEGREDIEGARSVEQERAGLARELSRAVGLGGRKRGLGDPAEKARKAVSARIRASIRKISDVHPELGVHLQRFVTTGNFCIYEPTPAVHWCAGDDR